MGFSTSDIVSLTRNFTLEPKYAELTTDVSQSGGHMHLTVPSIFALIAQILLITMNITGNSLVISLFIMVKDIRKKLFNVYIFNLAIADLLVTIDMLTSLLKWYYGRWPLGANACNVFMILIYTAIYMSALMITIMSIDRYLRICRPILYRLHENKAKTRKVVKAILLTLWIVVFVLYSILAFGWTALTGDPPAVNYNEYCEMQYIDNVPMIFVSLGFEFFIPLILLSFFNAKVYLEISKQIKLFQRLQNKTLERREESCSEDVSLSSEVSAEENSDSPKIVRKLQMKSFSKPHDRIKTKFNKRRVREHRKLRRSAIFLAMYVVVFICCWLPFYIMLIVQSTCKTKTCERSVNTYVIMVYILDLNSVINPILYSISNRVFRQYLWAVVFCRVKMMFPSDTTSLNN